MSKIRMLRDDYDCEVAEKDCAVCRWYGCDEDGQFTCESPEEGLCYNQGPNDPRHHWQVISFEQWFERFRDKGMNIRAALEADSQRIKDTATNALNICAAFLKEIKHPKGKEPYGAIKCALKSLKGESDGG